MAAFAEVCLQDQMISTAFRLKLRIGIQPMDFRLTAGLSGYSRLNGNTCEEEQSICWRLAVRSCTGLVMSTMAHDMLFRGLVWHVHAAGASTSGPPGHSFSTCLPLFIAPSQGMLRHEWSTSPSPHEKSFGSTQIFEARAPESPRVGFRFSGVPLELEISRVT